MAFSSAATRMLLSGDGMTTPLLQALVHGPLRARADGVRTVGPAVLPPGIGEALRPDIRDNCLLRRSRLLTVTDPSQPVGFALAEAEVVLRRRIVHVGRATWPDGTPCAVKTYTLDSDGRPLLCIRELFNPFIVDAAVRVKELTEMEPVRAARSGPTVMSALTGS
ncbi:hypothetical protein [Streptomyces niveus]|uniref:hypothetical protein n=1 Tax=Streptomyces niveus TaxID=193462 RepID=UPI0036877349